MRRLVVRKKIGMVEKFETTHDGTLILRESEGPRLAVDIISQDTTGFKIVSTIEEAENHFMAAAARHIREKNHRYGYMTVFDLNAQSAMVAHACKRGNGWVAMMHPEMFERIRLFPEDQRHIRDSQWDFIPVADQPRIGRWTLVASEDYRGIHVWLSDHLPRNVTYCAYRGPHHEYNTGIKNQLVDGMIAMQEDDHFVLAPIGTKEEGLPLSTYISCWTHPEIDP